jgi:membrane protein implicated in regulation of membrane protease activity
VESLTGLPDGWSWLILSGLVLLGETLGAAGFLLGISAAAFLTGLIAFIAPDVGWRLQMLLFAALSLVMTALYWWRFRRFNEATDQPQLNQRVRQMIGSTHVLTDTYESGEGRLQIGDTLWRIRSATPLTAGTRVRVTGAEGMTLLVEQL